MSGQPGRTKRNKELARAEKQREKASRRDQRRREKEDKASRPAPGGEDPDLAGIVPGPQVPSK
jgi:hypothetical protein